VNSGEFRDLAEVRSLVRTASAGFARLTDGVDHPLVVGSRGRLETIDTVLTRAAGGLSPTARQVLGGLEVVVVTWVAATLAALAGLSGGSRISVTLVAVIVMIWPIYRFHTVLGQRLNQRRTRIEPSRPEPNPALPDLTERGADVQHRLARTRDALTALIRRRLAGSRHRQLARTPAGFDWLRRNDYPLLLLSLADRQLCVVAETLAVWLTIQDGQQNQNQDEHRPGPQDER
jgi:hypothetical protein